MSLSRATFLVHPHAGGTFTVFTTLRAALAPLGVDLRWLGASHDPDSTRAEFPSDLAFGRLLDARGLSPQQLGQAYLDALRIDLPDLLFVNVLTSIPEMSLAACLPSQVCRLAIVHNITPGTYAAARAVRPYVHAAIGVCPRIREHLTKRLGYRPEAALCVPNALDFSPFDAQRRPDTAPNAPFRVLSLGRIVDADKGVFWLPQILSLLADIPLQLSIAGTGPDLDELRRRCAPLGDRVSFLGRVAPHDVPALTARHDALLMPSRFEGFGYTLIESAAMGCVPIASRIRGVTDFVVQDGITGLLFDIGNTAAAAAHIRSLASGTALRARLAQAAAADVRRRFSIATMTDHYRAILDALPGLPASIPSGDSSTFAPLRVGGAWRRLVPTRLKNALRRRLMR